MLTLNISEADIIAANYERIHNPLRAIRKRMDAIYWTSQGFSRQTIAQLSGVHRNSVCSYIKQYNKGIRPAKYPLHIWQKTFAAPSPSFLCSL